MEKEDRVRYRLLEDHIREKMIAEKLKLWKEFAIRREKLKAEEEEKERIKLETDGCVVDV